MTLAPQESPLTETLQAFVWKSLKRVVWRRGAGVCGLCCQPVALAEMQIDHIILVAQGGTHNLANLRPLTRSAISAKVLVAGTQTRNV